MRTRQMKYAALCVAAAAAVAFTACEENNNDDGAPQEHPLLGEVSFATDSIWRVGSQEWSDVVQAAKCSSKTDYVGYDSVANKYCADCAANPTAKGDFFSWEMVKTYKDYLCPDGWRVPTRSDFIALDVDLGGTGENRGVAKMSYFNDTYFNAAVWGAQGHKANAYGSRDTIVVDAAVYWSQQEHSADLGFGLLLLPFAYAVNPQHGFPKNGAISLRCVRDAQ